MRIEPHMSMRIETGFTFPKYKLDDFQRRAYARITESLTEELRALVERGRDLEKRERTQYWNAIRVGIVENHACGYHFFFEDFLIYAYFWGRNTHSYNGLDLNYVRVMPYWTNRDKPESISDFMWALHKEKWIELLNQEGAPSPWNRKLTWQVIDGFEIHKIMMELIRGGVNNVPNAV